MLLGLVFLKWNMWVFVELDRLRCASGPKRLETGLMKTGERKKKQQTFKIHFCAGYFLLLSRINWWRPLCNIIVALLCNNYYHFLMSPLLFLVSIITPAERPKLSSYYFKAISTPTSIV